MGCFRCNDGYNGRVVNEDPSSGFGYIEYCHADDSCIGDLYGLNELVELNRINGPVTSYFSCKGCAVGEVRFSFFSIALDATTKITGLKNFVID